MNDAPKFLIALDSIEQAERMKWLLESEFGNGVVESGRDCLEVQETLEKGDFTWLVIAERLPFESNVTVNLPHGGTESVPAEDEHMAGFQLAVRWVMSRSPNAPVRRAVVFSESDWDGPRVFFTRRILGTPTIGWENRSAEFLEMIHAADREVVFPATVIRFRFEKDDEACTLRFDGVEDGPLQVFLEHTLNSQNLSLGFEFQFDDRQYTEVQKAEDDVVRQREVKALTHQLHQSLESSGFLAMLEGILRRLDDKWPFQPYAIQLHIISNAQALRCPIDIALRSGGSTRGLLCNRLPIVWRLDLGNDGIRSEQRMQSNAFRYSEGSFAVVYSNTPDATFTYDAKQYDKIGGVDKHSAAILASVGLADVPQEASSKDDLARIFREGQNMRRVHVTAHGFHCNDADYAGVLVPTDPDSDKVATVQTLKSLDSLPVEFAYFNCCDLGYHEVPETTEYSFHACFAEALISERVCRETICNRWTVTQECAFDVADHFYQWKPRTIQGRAVALVLARLRSRQINDVSWLAPVHVCEHF
jgi:hypothetical protein